MEKSILILEFSFDGASYTSLVSGENSVSVVLVEALKKYFKLESEIVFAGRLDRGVSASSMIASVEVSFLQTKRKNKFLKENRKFQNVEIGCNAKESPRFNSYNSNSTNSLLINEKDSNTILKSFTKFRLHNTNFPNSEVINDRNFDFNEESYSNENTQKTKVEKLLKRNLIHEKSTISTKKLGNSSESNLLTSEKRQVLCDTKPFQKNLELSQCISRNQSEVISTDLKINQNTSIHKNNSAHICNHPSQSICNELAIKSTPQDAISQNSTGSLDSCSFQDLKASISNNEKQPAFKNSVKNHLYSINIAYMLNNTLPRSVFIKGWGFSKDFNARHDCKMRHYKYFFDLSCHRLNKKRLLECFRNHCKKQETQIKLNVECKKMNQEETNSNIKNEKEEIFLSAKTKLTSEIDNKKAQNDIFMRHFENLSPSICENNLLNCEDLAQFVLNRMKHAIDLIYSLDSFKSLCKKSFERDCKRNGNCFDEDYYFKKPEIMRIKKVCQCTSRIFLHNITNSTHGFSNQSILENKSSSKGIPESQMCCIDNKEGIPKKIENNSRADDEIQERKISKEGYIQDKNELDEYSIEKKSNHSNSTESIAPDYLPSMLNQCDGFKRSENNCFLNTHANFCIQKYNKTRSESKLKENYSFFEKVQERDCSGKTGKSFSEYKNIEISSTTNEKESKHKLVNKNIYLESNPATSSIQKIDDIRNLYSSMNPCLFCSTYYFDIKGKSFLHNMVRRIFHTIHQYAFCYIDKKMLEDILKGEHGSQNADPRFLLFCCGSYDKEIVFYRNTKNNEEEDLKKLDYLIECHKKN